MKTQKTLILQRKGGAYTMSRADFVSIFGHEPDGNKDEHGTLKHFGPWQIPVSYRALCTSRSFAEDDYSTKHSHPLHVYGFRTLTSVRESGYELEGRVSVNGRKVRGFTSSTLLDVDGTLVSVSNIHACDMHETPNT